MAQPTIVGESGKVNGKTSSPNGGRSESNASMRTRQQHETSAPPIPTTAETSSKPAKNTVRPRAPRQRPVAPPLHRGRQPIRSTRSSRSAAPASSPTPTARSSSRWKAPRSRRLVASSRPTSSSPSTSARPASTATRSRARRSVRQVVYRIAHTIREAGEQLRRLLRRPRRTPTRSRPSSRTCSSTSTARSTRRCGSTAASSSATASTGSGGNWALGRAPGRRADESSRPTNAYERPQCSACFIQSVDDDLMSIYELVKNEARLFKYGSGTGSNFSAIRGKQEKLSGGGTLERPHELPRGASIARPARPSRGGTTRRAAKMVCLDMDHPEIVDFINWKVREEKKAHALIAAGYSSDFNGEAYHTISGQNSNNSVRVTDDFMRPSRPAASGRRTCARRGEVVRHATSAQGPLAAGRRGRVGLRRSRACSTTRPSTAGTPARTPGASTRRTRAPSTCSSTTRPATCRRSTSPSSSREDGVVRRRGLPPRRAASSSSRRRSWSTSRATRRRTSRKNSHDYRPLGLGYANLGTLLMLLGIPYDSRRGPRDRRRAHRDHVRPRLQRRAPRWRRRKGPFAGFAKNREPMLRVMGMHRDAAYAIDRDKLPRRPSTAPRCEDWDEAVQLGERARLPQRAGDRARADRHHRPPDGLRHDRHRARLRAREVQEARRRRLLQDRQPVGARGAHAASATRRREVQEIVAYVSGTNTLLARAARQPRDAQGSAASPTTTSPRSRRRSPASFELDLAFAPVGPRRRGLRRGSASPKEQRGARGFSLLKHLGFTQRRDRRGERRRSSAA